MSPRLEAPLFRDRCFCRPSLSQLTPSVFDKDGVAPDRHLPDQRRYSPLPFSMIRGNAGGDAKATCAESQLALRVEPQLPPDSAASPFRPPRTGFILSDTPLCLLPQIHF